MKSRSPYASNAPTDPTASYVRRAPWLAALAASCVLLATEAWAEDKAPSFRRDVARIFIERCVACHRFDRAEGGYRADNYAGLAGEGDSGLAGIVAGAPQESEVFRRVVSPAPDERMPFESDPLEAAEIARLRAWILAGAKYDAAEPTAALETIVPPAVYPPAPRTYPGPWPIAALAFSARGKRVYVGGYHEVTTWEIPSERLVARVGNLPERILGLSLHPDGRRLAVAGGEPGRSGDVRLVDLEAGKVSDVLLTSGDVVLAVAWSPDGEKLAVAGSDGAVRLFSGRPATELFTVRPHSDWIYSVTWSPDGAKLATASRDGTAKALAADDGETLASYPGHSAPVRGAAFSADAAHVVSVAKTSAHRWKTADGKREGDPVPLEGAATSLASSGDTFLVTTDAHKLFRLSGETGKPTGEPEDLAELPLVVNGSSDGTRLVIGHFDGRLTTLPRGRADAARVFIATPKE